MVIITIAFTSMFSITGIIFVFMFRL